jgi:hypothetical protein
VKMKDGSADFKIEPKRWGVLWLKEMNLMMIWYKNLIIL